MRGIKKPAMFERPLYLASIVENVPAGHPIINVVFNGSLASYGLLAHESACWREFEVNTKSGLITNKVRTVLSINHICIYQSSADYFQGL